MQRFLLTLAVAVFAVANMSAITLEEILAKNLAARGGKAKLEAIKTYTVDGTMSMAQGMDLSFTQSMKRPMKFRMDMSFQGMSMVTAFDGTTAWSKNPMAGNKVEKAPESEVKRMAEQADLDGVLVNSKEKGYKLELVGSEDIDGSTAYKIKVTDKDNEVSHLFVDAVTWLEVMWSKSMSMMGQEADVEILMSNYQDIAGVQMPMLMEIRSEGQTIMSMTYSNPKVNEPIADDRFAFPGDAGEPKKDDKAKDKAATPSKK
jgi:outer membrane lipoprotein-sorting protein